MGLEVWGRGGEDDLFVVGMMGGERGFGRGRYGGKKGLLVG